MALPLQIRITGRWRVRPRHSGYDSLVYDLLDIYRRTLERCGPDQLVAPVADPGMPRDVVAIGKCAGPLLDGFARAVDVHHALAAIPEGYRRPAGDRDVVTGGHPDITPASFAAGKRVAGFVEGHDAITFLISGGGAARVGQTLVPRFRGDEPRGLKPPPRPAWPALRAA